MPCVSHKIRNYGYKLYSVLLCIAALKAICMLLSTIALLLWSRNRCRHFSCLTCILLLLCIIFLRNVCVATVDNQIENVWSSLMWCWMKYLIQRTSLLM